MSRLDDVLLKYQKLGIRDQLDYEKLYMYSIITHSTAIEGSTVTEVENQLLFDEGISPDKPISEQLMNLDLKAAYEKAYKEAEDHKDITVESLCMLSGIVMKNTGSSYKIMAGDFDSSKGELRLMNVSAGRGGRSYMAWQKVPLKLEEFCSWLDAERKKMRNMSPEEKYRLSFEAHYRLVMIHPWADGNGRMSRLLMNMLQYEAGVLPSVVKRNKRAEYIESLSSSRENEDVNIFLDFMLKHHIENLEAQIREYERSLDEDVNGGDG